MKRSGRKIPLLPATVRARLTVTIVLASVLLFVFVYTVTTFATSSSVQLLISQAAAEELVRYALPLGLGLISLLLGLVLGLILARLILRPIEGFVTYMRDEGNRAIEGLPFQEDLVIDKTLPIEFIELGEVIQELLHSLRERQAELQRVNDQAVAAEQAFRTVVNDSSEVKLLARAGVVDIANPAAAACLDMPLGLILKQPIEALFSRMNVRTEDGESLNLDTLFELALDQPTLVQCDSVEEERWMKVSVSESTSPDTYLITARNVTEEHRLEALRAEIVSLVSHDLRAPLTVISGYLELLAHPLDAPTRARAFEAASTAVGRMSSMLGELLETTRAEQVFPPSAFNKIPLGNLASEVAEAMRLGCSREIVVIQRRRAIVLGDDLRLRQAIENLIGNAIKHTPEGTGVTVVVDANERCGILAVEDHGPGIPDDQRDSVFERFTRLRGSIGRDGVGLGLYIVRVIAESHGGTVRVDAAEGGGARFVLEIPLAPAPRHVNSGVSDQLPDESPSA
ncbi:MAG: HAMP domain-containing histidine kinase [Actinomycetia bacterium]|nr:HAMP domain-containing histidine kinase [Actinomycetes bacterium]